MPITPSQVVVRVRKNVLDQRVANSCRPTMPDDVLRKSPCLGYTDAGVRGLHSFLVAEFAPEKLELSAAELGQFNTKTVSDLASVVYQRIRPYNEDAVADRVIETIKSVLGPGTAVDAVTPLGAGGLGLSAKNKGEFAGFLKASFNPLIRLIYSSAKATAATHVRDWIGHIRLQFQAQGR
jgi:hypothetical protein